MFNLKYHLSIKFEFASLDQNKANFILVRLLLFGLCIKSKDLTTLDFFEK